MKPKIILSLALVLSGFLPGCSTASNHAGKWGGSSTNDWRTKAIASEADLDRVVSQLQIPAKRFDAMLTLLDFAGMPRGDYTDDPKVNELHIRARDAMDNCPGLDAVIDTMIAGLNEPDKRLPMIAALLQLSAGFDSAQMYGPDTPLQRLMSRASMAAHKAFDVPTVEKALDGPDWFLRIKAVEHFAILRDDTNQWKLSKAEISEWKRLLPRMEELAAGDDVSIRNAAARSLRRIPGTEALLAGRETNETSANVIMTLLSERYVGEDGQERFESRFLTLFVPLLSNPDEKVREGALTFVANNHISAPMYHIPFGMDVYERVIASTKAKSANERWAAASALKEVRTLNTDRSRETFLYLVDDPDEDVRSVIADGLADQLDREDVKQAIAVLLKDKSPIVRSQTIMLAVGWRECIPELEELSKCPDPYVADMAADTLKGIK